MSEYTPTTEEVRRYYIAWGAESGPDDAAGEFDRWLAVHDAEVRADEREKAAERIAKGVRHAYDCPGLDDWNACDCGMKLMYDLAAARGDGAK